MGVLSPTGVGVPSFRRALEKGDTCFSSLTISRSDRSYEYPAALLSGFDYKEEIRSLLPDSELMRKALSFRHLSVPVSHGVYAAVEAYRDSGLLDLVIDPGRQALVSGGNNFQQGHLNKVAESYCDRLAFINPTNGFTFLDTDLVGLLSELLNIQGEGYSVGGASASGSMALINGCRLIASGEYEVVLVVAPSTDLSIYEYQSLTSLGAMASVSINQDVSTLCAPFDRSHCGFVYGQNAAAVVLESESHARRRGASVKGRISGYGTALDANRQPNPSVLGELRAMQNAMVMSGISASSIDYVNTHGTGAILGDRTEIEALLAAGLSGVKANATKSLTGHGISSAGLVEAVACLVQMAGGFLHPNPYLKNPITKSLDWVGPKAVKHSHRRVLSNSFGFGGINTSVVLEAPADDENREMYT